MPAEIVISAALIVLAIAFSAALVAVCVVVGSAFVSITVALSDRAPRLLRAPERRPPREEPRPPEVVKREEEERADSDLASDIMSNAAEGFVVYDREMRCQVWNRFMEELTGLRAEQVLGKRASDFFPIPGEQQIEDVLARVLKGETVSLAETSHVVPGSERLGLARPTGRNSTRRATSPESLATCAISPSANAPSSRWSIRRITMRSPDWQIAGCFKNI